MSFITDLESLIERFGKWVSSLFKNGEHLYKELTDAEKQAAEWSYGTIAILNKYADDIPAALDAIGVKYPGLSSDVLHGFLDTLIRNIKTIENDTPLTLEEAATEVAKYLGTLDGQVWQGISQSLGNLLAILFSPETPVQKFIGVAEYVYRALVKPHVEGE